MNTVEHGPLLEGSQISSGIDYYKATMSQLEYELHPNVEVVFTFHNRGQNRLADYVNPETLQARLDYFGRKAWSREELDYLSGQLGVEGEKLFSGDFLDYLAFSKMPPIAVGLDATNIDLEVTTTGNWPMVTFWETIAMSEVNELYFESYVRAHGLDLMKIYSEGDRRLSQKIAILQANPDIKFADFGTRRRFSLRWQKHVIDRLVTECQENFIGTSNISLARLNDVWPIGTFAHEMPMVYAALADATGGDIRSAQKEFLDDWSRRYGENLSTALTDTFTSEFFFNDFTPEQARQWKVLRHDSGDPVEFGEKAISFYENYGIDPTTKTIVFSDGLDIDEIVRLYEYFKDRVNIVFGWGTTLTNDLGIPALNIVMKATAVNGIPTVKLSDSAGKYTGPMDKIRLYGEVFNQVLTHS